MSLSSVVTIGHDNIMSNIISIKSINMSCFILLNAQLCASICIIYISGATDSFCGVVKSPGVEGDGSKFKLVPLQSEGEPADRQADAGQRCQQIETSPQASISHACGSSQEKEKRMTEPQTGQLLKEVGSICLSENKQRF